MKISVALLTLLTLFSLNTFAQVDIPDANLRAKVLAALDKPADAQLTLADMENLTELRAADAGISDLTGLEHATNLTKLGLWNNQVSDISALSGLTNLEYLYLDGNQVSDISALSGLTNLEYLHLWGNQVSDISALSGLTNLTGLRLNHNQVSDISALSGLTNLTTLLLDDNQVSDISALSGLTNLTGLGLSYNQVSDISALSGLTNLTSLELRGNQVSDISALSGLTNLTWLHLWGNQVSDISALSGLTNLTHLILDSNPLSDISALSGLTNLTTLGLNHNQVSDISALSGLTNLTTLWLDGNPLSYASIYTHIPTLQQGGVDVTFTNRTPTGLAIESGDNQDGEASTPLAQPFVVKVTDEHNNPFEEVPVTFTVTQGSGTLSTTSTTTDADGLAESTLTLGSSAGTNTVEVSASKIQPRVVFNAEGSVTGPPAQVNIPDANLRTAIENALGVDAGEPITKAEMETLTGLYAWNANIRVLTGLEHATNLKDLNLNNNNISDLSPLAGLTELTGGLGLSGNNISDLSPLAGLTELKTLYLDSNGVSDLSPLAGLTELKWLILNNNDISELAPLAGLTNLTELWLNNNNISDISPLAGLTKLIYLWLKGNPLNAMAYETYIPEHQSRETRVTFDEPKADLVEIPDDNLRAEVLAALDKPTDAQLTLADMENLTELDARGEGISDLTGLQHATNLTILYLSNNPLSDISVLAGLTNLTRLYLSFNQISDISALAGLTNLTTLWLAGNPLSDISVLAGLTSLTILGLNDNPLSDISVLAGLTNLTRLYLSGNQISDISALAGLTNLTILDLARNQILDISVLAGLTKLETLQLLVNPLSYASIYTVIPTLQDNGVDVRFTNRTPTGLAIDSGNNQTGEASTPLAQAFVVKVTDEHDAAFEGVPVTFTVTQGGGTLSTTSTTTTADGLAESTLTLGSSADTNTVEVSASKIQQRVVFNTEGSVTDAPAQVTIPDANLRAKVLAALDKPTDAQLTLADMANLTNLDARRAGISDLTGLQHATNLTELRISHNQISDISALANLTKLTTLVLTYNQLSDISALADLTNLTELWLNDTEQISDISVLANLTNLTWLTLSVNQLSDISALANLTNLRTLWLVINQISDISALSGLTNLEYLYLRGNQISDISALLGLTNLTGLELTSNPLSYAAIYTHIPTLQQGGVAVQFTNRTPTGLAVDSGNNQTGETSTPLAQAFVVKVTDEHDAAFEGVPVTFTVTQSGGTLSVRSTTTTADGLAESTLTLGSRAGTNTVEVSASKIQQRVVFNVEGTRKRIVGDVNQDGVVNIFDLVLVANRFGQTGEDRADVNEDGLVNILDLVLVAGAFGDPGAAAPAKHPQALELLSATDVKQWLIQARGLGLTDATSQKGLIFLEQLLAVLTPSKTTLLPNYPNPFNPETWIPYRLSKDAFVTLTIYDQRGRVVRQIDVGHRTAAVYERRDKAIYWDGRNAVGEAVASGVYFYTLTTGDFTATRKMLILK